MHPSYFIRPIPAAAAKVIATAAAVALVFVVSGPAGAQVTLPTEYKIKAGRLGRIEAKSPTPVKWINLADGLDLIPDSSGRWAFVLGNTAGTYKIAAYTCGKDGPADPAYCLVVVDGPNVKPGGSGPGPSSTDPVKATGRLRFGNSGCTATIIGPRRADGYWSALTAAHCTGSVGSMGQMTIHDGRVFKVVVTARDTNADLSWLRIDQDGIESLPFATLAKETPAIGTKVWHQGYGVDKPGTPETGTVPGVTDSNGQIKFSLSVSSGDSGSGIFRDDTGELVAAVCCTQSRGQKVTMWGGSSVSAAKIHVDDDRERPIITYPILEDWIPSILPTRTASTP